MKVLCMLLLSLSAFANYQVESKIFDIEDNGDEKTLDVLVDYNGRIFKVNRDDEELLKDLNFAKENNISIKLSLESNFITNSIFNKIERISEVKLLENRSELLAFSEEYNEYPNPAPAQPISPVSNYTPTDLGSYEKANSIFKSLGRVGRTERRSQCFNRAYVWSKYMHKYHRVDSLKVLIYYSRRYRKEIPGSKWWFHIAPVVKVQNELYTMDYEFHRNPYTITDWQNYFTSQIPDKSYDCKYITHYSEFKEEYNDRREWCFLQLTSMYYWEPNDLERLERTGEQRTRFEDWILEDAVKEAFRKHRRVLDVVR